MFQFCYEWEEKEKKEKKEKVERRIKEILVTYKMYIFHILKNNFSFGSLCYETKYNSFVGRCNWCSDDVFYLDHSFVNENERERERGVRGTLHERSACYFLFANLQWNLVNSCSKISSVSWLNLRARYTEQEIYAQML